MEPLLAEADLQAAVQRALASPGARLGAWRATPLDHRVINPVTRGLYRLEGEALDAHGVRPFTLVLKVLQREGGEPGSPFAPSTDPHHWNYWRREALVYQAGWPAVIGGGLALPACYGVYEDEGSARLLLEAIEGERADHWDAGRYALTARQLGRFQGTVARAAEGIILPWASRGWLRAWAPTPLAADREATADAARWCHPLFKGLLAAAPDTLARLHAAHGRLLALSDRLPRTLCHLDCWAPNLFSRPGTGPEPQTVLLDWAMAGDGALGEDPANMVFDTVWMLRFPAEGLETLLDAVWDGYSAGLAEGGYRGDPREARLGLAISVAVRFGAWSVGLAKLAADPTRHAELEARYGHPIEALMAARAVVVARALALGDEALALAAEL